MAIQQLDLGAVYNTLAQQRALGLREQEAQQQGQMNVLRMAREQRENEQAQRQQNALARLNDPSLDEAGRQSILGEAFPELLAKQAFRDPKDSFLSLGDGTGLDLRDPNNPRTVGRDASPLDGESPTAPQQPRPTLAPGGRGPVPMPAQREELPASRPSANVPAVYQQTIDTHAERTGLSSDLIGRVFMAESGGRPDVVNGQTTSPAGAVGPMQTMPATLKDPGYGVQPARDGSVDEQFRVGTDYLAAMMEKYNGNQILALGAYNWGPGNVDKWLAEGADMSKVPAETKTYIKKILGDDLGLPQQRTAEAPRAQPAGDDGWLPVRNLKSAGISQDAPPGMMWVGRRRPDGSIEKKVAPIPGAPDDRADKRAAENFDQETKLRTEHQNLVKGFDVAQTNYATMPELAADESGGSDIALVNAFFKTFAPDSTVMEGEFVQAAKAAGLPDRVVGLIDKAMSGQMLTPQQRQELTTAAGRFYSQRKASVERANEQYTKLAKSYPGVNAERVVINPIRDLPKYEPKPKAETKPKEEPKRQDVPDARLAADGKWYVADPARPGKYLEVQ